MTIDGAAPLRRRPMGPLHDALARLGAAVESDGRLPVTVRGPIRHGGTLELPGDVSSQFLTALMLIGPLLEDGSATSSDDAAGVGALPLDHG